MSERSCVGRYCSISLRPNSRFMKELAVIWPTYPPSTARSKKRCTYFSVLNWASEYGLSLLTCGREWDWVTPRSFPVGTALAGGPPDRSQRALLVHWAPTLGAGAESHVRPGMRDAGGREPPRFEPAHPAPGQAVALAPAPQRPTPVPRNLLAECRHGVDVAGNRVVGDVSAHHAAQPVSLLGDGPMTPSHDQGFHLAQLGRHSFSDRLPPQREPSSPRLRAHVREAEE